MWHIICALQCEARSLITHFQLQKDTESPSFPLYIDKHRKISLTVSGTGKINAAAATAFTHAFLKTAKQNIWVNIGIAGHGELAIGELVLGHKIVDQATQLSWYPQLIGSWPCNTMEILSCDAPCSDYAVAVLEMEAAGFYATACRFATSELIHVIKVITDNQQQPVTKMAESLVAELLQQQIVLIERLLNQFDTLAKTLDSPKPVPPHYEQIIAQWRFTHAQREILRTCLQRWQVLCPDDDPIAEIGEADRGQDVLDRLIAKLDSCPVHFSQQ